MRTIEQIKAKRTELLADEKKFTEFLEDAFKDEDISEKVNLCLWRIRKQIKILDWIINDDLPF